MAVVARLAASLRAAVRGESDARTLVGTLGTSAAILLFNVASGVLLARLLGPETRGQFAAIQVLPRLLATACIVGQGHALVYFGAKKQSRLGAYVAVACSIALLSSLLTVGVCWFVVPVIVATHGAAVVAASRLYLLLLPANALRVASAETARATQRYGVWNSLRAGPFAFWLIVVLVATSQSWKDAVSLSHYHLCLVLGFWTVALLTTKRLLSGLSWPRLTVARRFFRYGLPLGLAEGSAVMIQRFDHLVVAAFFSSSVLGCYAVAASAAALVGLLSSAIAWLTLPKVAAAKPAERHRVVKKSLLWNTIGSAAVLAAGIPLIPVLVPLLYGEDFRPAVTLCQVLLVACVLRGMGDVLAAALQGLGRPGASLAAEGSALATTIPCALLLVPVLAAMGPALATVAGQTVRLLLVAWIYRRVSRG